MAPPFRADHIGSLLRPPELVDARIAHAEGSLTDEQLRELEDQAILTALQMQREAGIGIYTAGEYRRAMWLTGLPAAVEGFVRAPVPLIGQWHEPETGTLAPIRLSRASTSQGWAIGGKLRATRRITGIES